MRARFAHLFVLLAMLGLPTSCAGGLFFSGASEPTPYTFHLLESDWEEAAALDCEQTWFTGDPEADVQKGLQLLKERKVKITYRNPVAGGTVTPRRIFLTEDFKDGDPKWQARLLRHELTHYCDIDRVNFETFYARYTHSAGRHVFELRAYVQSIRAEKDMGHSEKRLRAYAEEIIAEMRDTYFTWDIDPEEYERETRRILLESVGLEPLVDDSGAPVEG